ncbi:MAG: acyl-CoA thioesterase [FCB group bacterium]|nr:acyl-CoA thioesterase [FCB group bacterium]
MIEHHYSVTVYYKDVDQMGIVYYSRYLEYFEMARTECLTSIGLSVTELETTGIFLPVVHCSCDYHLGARFENRLDVVSRIMEKPRSTLRIDYSIYRESDHKQLVTGHTLHAFVNRNGNPVRPSKKILNVITQALTS